METYNIETYLLTDEKSTPAACADLFQRGGIPGQSTSKINGDTSKWKTGSWAHNLQADPSLDMAVYDAANVAVPDLDGDDTVVSPEEAKAVMTGPNRDIVISTMVDPDYINPYTGEKNYNHENSIRAYSQYRGGINKQAAEKARADKFGDSPAAVNENKNGYEVPPDEEYPMIKGQIMSDRQKQFHDKQMQRGKVFVNGRYIKKPE